MSEILANPRISVIIPTWNRALSVKRAITSALRQTYPPCEILVCDDGSTDGTEEVVRSMGDSRVRWIAGDHAGCPAVPRNRGIAASMGSWLAFLDSDDEWYPEKLEAQVALVRKTGARAVCTNAYREVDGIIKGLMISGGTGTLHFSDLVRDNKVICSSVLVDRSVLHQTGGFPEHPALRVGEDLCLWLKISRLAPIAYADEAFIVYKDAPTTSVRSHGPTAAVQRQRAYQSFVAWRWGQCWPGALIDILAILAISCGSALQARYHESRACLGALRRRLIWSRRMPENREPMAIAGLNSGPTPVISVLLPVHNASAYVRRAIDSVLAQTFPDFELIVVNDASTDGSAAVLDDLHDQRIVRVNFEKNRGIVDALNIALKHARGRYIARMDADDIARLDRFQLQVDFLEQHPKVAVVGAWIEGFGDVRRPYLHCYPTSHDEILSYMLFESPFAHPSVLIRRTAMDSLDRPYSPDFPYVEDWELWSRLVLLGNAANIPMPLLRYRIHTKSSSRRFTQIQGASKRKLLQKIYADADLPFREEFVLASSPVDFEFLRSCFRYFEELVRVAENNRRLNSRVLADVLQEQLRLRARRIVSFGMRPAWFVLKCNLTPAPLPKRLLAASKIFLLNNVRALIALRRKPEVTE